MPTFAEIAQDPNVQAEFDQYKLNHGFGGSITDYLKQSYWNNSGANPYQITGEYNAAIYNQPMFRTAYRQSQDAVIAAEGEDSPNIRTPEEWLTGFIAENPDQAFELNVIDPNQAADLQLADEINNLSDEDFDNYLEFLRGVGNGDIGQVDPVSFSPVMWQDAVRGARTQYQLADWEDLSVDDLIASLQDTEALKDQRLEGINQVNAARTAAVKSQQEAINQGLSEVQNQIARERNRGGFVGNSSYDTANLVKATTSARQDSALAKAMTRIQNLSDLSEGKLANEALDYDSGVKVGEVKADRDRFNLTGRSQTSQFNANQKRNTDQFEASRDDTFEMFNKTGRNDTNRFNSQMALSAASTNAGIQGGNIDRRWKAMREVNDVKDAAVNANTGANPPNFLVFTPQGVQQFAGDPGQFGNTLSGLGNGMFALSWDDIINGDK